MVCRLRSAARRLVLCAALSVLLVGCGTAPVTSTSGTYTVRPGDTVYSIATRHGMSVDALRQLNGIGRDFLIYPGQVLKVAGTSAGNKAGMANANRSARTADKTAEPPITVRPPTTLRFVMPTQGSYVSTTRPNGGQGWLFTGRLAQPIMATESGRVVYSGNGLLGYGQLLIIKHDDSYLSAYGHLGQVSVHEGDQVQSGQVIAGMGNGTNGSPQLYFEIRYNGRPIDPGLMFSR